MRLACRAGFPSPAQAEILRWKIRPDALTCARTPSSFAAGRPIKVNAPELNTPARRQWWGRGCRCRLAGTWAGRSRAAIARWRGSSMSMFQCEVGSPRSPIAGQPRPSSSNLKCNSEGDASRAVETIRGGKRMPAELSPLHLQAAPPAVSWMKLRWTFGNTLHPKIPFTTLPSSPTPVSRTSRPWNFTVSRWWLMPSWCSRVACRSWTWTTFSTEA